MIKKVKLGDICDLSIGFVGTVTTQYEEGGIPFLRTLNVKPYKIVDDDLKRITREFHASQKKSQLLEGDIAMVHTGVPGICCVIPQEYNNSNCIDMIVIKPHKEEVDSYYLAAYMNTVGYKHIEKQQVGCIQKHFNLKDAVDLEVFLPDIDTQHRIGSLVNEINRKIEVNNQLIEEYDKLMSLVFIQWFFKYEYPNSENKPYKSSGGAMEFNEILEKDVPRGWVTESLGNLSKSNRGVSYTAKTLSDNEGVPMLTLGCANKDGSFNVGGIQHYTGEYNDDKIVKPFDLIIYNTDMSSAKYVVGRTILVPELFEECVSSHHLTKIKFADEELKWYFYHLTRTEYFRKYIKGFATGTNVIGLDYQGIEDYTLLIPDKETLNKFVQLAMTVEKQKSKLVSENMELASYREFILPMLISGQACFKR